MSTPLPVLDYLRKMIDGTLAAGDVTHLKYPTAISTTLGIRLAAVGPGTATLEIDADPGRHGNQQGTIHGGLLAELADAAMGTAHSTGIEAGQSFTSLDLNLKFLRPVWKSTLRASAKATHSGKTISHYACEIVRDDGKIAAQATGIFMTLYGEQAKGR
ncbi:MAG TPA: PaaI family thioesterase [Candidatus Methylacidiphilales bacterium]